MANQRMQIIFTNGDEFSGIIPDTLPFTDIEAIPTTFQTSYCGQMWRKKSDIATIKTEDVTVDDTNLGFVLRDDPTWGIFLKLLYGEQGVDSWALFQTTYGDSAFLNGTTIYP